MSDSVISRGCKCCGTSFSAANMYLEFCSGTCINTYYNIQQEELLGHKKVQLAALHGLTASCLSCGKAISPLNYRHQPKSYCSAKCVLRSHRTDPIERPCVHCDTPVMVAPNLRPNFVRCPKHRDLWHKVQQESARNVKKVRAAEGPYDQYLLRGPWWDHKRRGWTVRLMHSGASSQRELEYARYLLSVREGKRLNDSVPLVYLDGDRTNVDLSNLALG